MPASFSKGVIRFKTDSYGLASQDSEPWQTRAACGGADIKLFTLGMTKAKKDGSSRKVLLDTIDRYCYECPVMLECERDADPIDRQFLVLGGLMPTFDRERPVKVQTARPAVSSPVPSFEQILSSQIFKSGMCRGAVKHEIFKPEDLIIRAGRVRCRKCINLREAVRARKVAAEKAALKAASGTMTA